MLRGIAFTAANIGAALGAPVNNTLGADVALNNSTYVTGPTIAQGTAGVWFVVATVTLSDSAATAQCSLRLTDGTTVISSGRGTTIGTQGVTVTLSGYISAPAGNLRVQAISNQAATTSFAFNNSGNSKDSSITAIRVG